MKRNPKKVLLPNTLVRIDNIGEYITSVLNINTISNITFVNTMELEPIDKFYVDNFEKTNNKNTFIETRSEILNPKSS